MFTLSILKSRKFTLLSLAVFFLTLFFSTAFISANELLIGCGDTDSFSCYAGKNICHSIKKYDENTRCTLITSSEAADNLTNIQSGSLDLALVSSKTIYDAFNRSGFFKYINIDYNNLRLLMPFYKQPVSLIVRKDARVAKLDDLVGKRINRGNHSSLENRIFGEMMKFKAWKAGDFPFQQNLSPLNFQDSLAMKSGSVQAMLHVGMHPDDKLKRLLMQSNSTIIGINDTDMQLLVEEKAGFSSCKIPGGTYPGLSEDLKTLAVETNLITSADTDDETIQLVLTAISESKKQLHYAHPAFASTKIEVATLNDSYLHPHPSAILFFQATINTY